MADVIDLDSQRALENAGVALEKFIESRKLLLNGLLKYGLFSPITLQQTALYNVSLKQSVPELLGFILGANSIASISLKTSMELERNKSFLSQVIRQLTSTKPELVGVNSGNQLLMYGIQLQQMAHFLFADANFSTTQKIKFGQANLIEKEAAIARIYNTWINIIHSFKQQIIDQIQDKNLWTTVIKYYQGDFSYTQNFIQHILKTPLSSEERQEMWKRILYFIETGEAYGAVPIGVVVAAIVVAAITALVVYELGKSYTLSTADKAIAEMAKKDAQTLYDKLDKLRDWVIKNPNATPEQIKQKAEELKKEGKREINQHAKDAENQIRGNGRLNPIVIGAGLIALAVVLK
jgi:hypothetical protein